MRRGFSTSDGPLVSILTPSFNQADWLGDTLRSVAVQTYPRIEHVVMDGGSTDGSVELLRRAPDVHWRSEPDRGQSQALNRAFARSHGEVIGWLNSDDAYFDRDVVEDVVGCFRSHPEVDIVYGHAVRVDQRGRMSYVLWVPPFSRWLLRWKCFLVQPAVFFRREALGDRFLDERFQFAMDWELWLRLARSCTFHHLNRVLAIDRDQPGRKIHTRQAVLEADRRRLATMYGIRLDPWYQRLGGFYELALRMSGAPLTLRLTNDMAFRGYLDPTAVRLARQFAYRGRWEPDRRRKREA